MIGAFFAWWIGQLTDLLPSWLGRSAPTDADALVIAPEGPLLAANAVAVGVRRGGREVPLGSFALGSTDLVALLRSPNPPAVVRLQKPDVLEKTLVLPLAAQSELEQALTFEMDRETPFSPEELHWSHRITAINRKEGKLVVHLVLLPKAALAPLLAALAPAGIVPGWAEIEDGPERLPLDGGRDRRPASRRLVPALAVCCVVLAVAATVI